VSAALVVLATALLTWPAAVPAVRRLSAPARTSVRSVARVVFPHSPALAAGAAATVAAVLSTPVVAALAGGCAALGVRAVRARRSAATGDARLLILADALGVLVAELRSGRSPAQAARAVVASCPEQATARLLAAALAVDGPDPPAADAPHDETARVRAAVRLSARTGCSLAAVLAALEDDLRARHRQRLDLRTGTAGPRAGAGVLAGLPLLGLAMGAGVGADPWHVLTATVAGQVLLVAGVGLEVAGVAWMARLVRRATSGAAVGRGR
jgi:tight adherence protein B